MCMDTRAHWCVCRAEPCRGPAYRYVYSHTCTWVRKTHVYVQCKKCCIRTDQGNNRPQGCWRYDNWLAFTANSSPTGKGTESSNGRVICRVPATLAFDAPVATAVSPNMPTSGAMLSVTVAGLNFGVSDQTMSVVLHGGGCPTVSWTSSTSANCVSSALNGIASALDEFQSSEPLTFVQRRFKIFTFAANHAQPGMLVGTVLGITGTSQPSFTFDAPVGSQLTGNHPMTAGSAATVSGLNFHMIDITASASTSERACRSLSWVSTSTVLCNTAQYSMSKLAEHVAITMAAASGTAGNVFSFDSPMFSYLDARNLPLSSDQSITLVGYNFGGLDLTVSAVLGSSACRSTSWVSNSAMLCSAVSGSGAGLNITLQTDGFVVVVPGFLTFDTPAVTSFSPGNGPSVGGASITIAGFNFGVVDFTASARLGDSIGLGHCRTTSWSSDSALLCGSGYGYNQEFTARSAVTISDVLGLSKSLSIARYRFLGGDTSGLGTGIFRYEGCQCSHFGSDIGNATAGVAALVAAGTFRCSSSGVCSCKPKYGGRTCSECSRGYTFDPSPYCMLD